MTTTSLKLPDDLKERAAAAALKLGISPHAFMVEAIRQAASAAEARAQFVADGQSARAELLNTGKGYAADEVHDYLRRRVTDKIRAKRPKAKAWQR